MKEFSVLLITLAVITPAIVADEEAHVPTKCPAKDSENKTVHIAHEKDCTKFYKCLAGMKILQDCPWSKLIGARLHFNRFKQVCDWPQDAGCEPITDPVTKPTTKPTTKHPPKPTERPPHPDECPKHGSGVRLVHEWACTRYYFCEEGLKREKRCPHGEHFDPIRRVCDLPEKANCKLPGKGLECPPKGSTEIVFLPHECFCELYYMCKDGKQIGKSCEDGMHFNRATGKCDTPENAKCPNARKPVKPRVCPREAIRLPHETRCSHFYQCINGERYLEKCPEKMHFQESSQLCVLPDVANCELEDKSY